MIAEGTYTTLLPNADTRVFIDRTYLETRAHREKRARHICSPGADKEAGDGRVTQHHTLAVLQVPHAIWWENRNFIISLLPVLYSVKKM